MYVRFILFLNVGDINFTKVMPKSIDRHLKSKSFRCQFHLHIVIDDDLFKFVLKCIVKTCINIGFNANKRHFLKIHQIYRNTEIFGNYFKFSTTQNI